LYSLKDKLNEVLDDADKLDEDGLTKLIAELHTAIMLADMIVGDYILENFVDS
jgi:hypothetical protein